MVVLAMIAGLLCLVVGGCFLAGFMPFGNAVKKAAAEAKKEAEAQERALAAVEIVDFQWTKQGFGSVMEANFKIRNNGGVDIKDIEIECVHTAPSGTQIDRNIRTIYEIVKAGETREFKNFNMGFIDAQVSRSSPRITNIVTLPGPASKP